MNRERAGYTCARPFLCVSREKSTAALDYAGIFIVMPPRISCGVLTS